MWKRGLSGEEDNILQVINYEEGLPDTKLSETWQKELNNKIFWNRVNKREQGEKE